MGSAPGKLQTVDVINEKPHYPPPSPPRFNFGDLFKNIPIHDDQDVADEGFNWTALEWGLKVEELRNAQEKQNGPDEIKAVFDANVQIPQPVAKVEKGKKYKKKERNNPGNNDVELQKPEKAEIPLKFNSRKKIDQHAREALPMHAAMFESLFSYLKQPIKAGFYPQTFFVRGLMAWLSYQNIQKGKYGLTSLGSPNGILQHVKLQSLTYVKAFTLLCRAANIPCVIIDGYVKTGDYEPGDVLDQTFEDSWCAVYVDESWQIVHPLWIILGNYGRRVPGQVLIDRREVIQTVPPNKEQSRRKWTFNEDFFMPPPEEFVNKCYAKKPEWQLLPPAKIVKTPEEFEKLAYITKTFLRYRLSFVSESSSLLKSKDGQVRIEILALPHMASRLMFQCILTPKSVTGEGTANKEVNTTNYSKLVLSFRSNERFVFEARLPFEGVYKLELLGGVDKLYALCTFILVCDEPLSLCHPLPFDTSSLGWGPGPTAEKCGLILPSNPTGFITILPTEGDGIVPPSKAKPENIINISFQLGRNALIKYDYTAELCASYSLTATNVLLTKDMKKDRQKENERLAAKNLGRCVEGTRDHVNRLLKMRVTVPREGEYALVIKATDCIIKKERKIPQGNTTRPVCYYLLSAKEDWAKQYTPEKLARRELHNAMSDGNIERLEKAIAKCKGVKIPVVDSSVAAAELRIEYMKIRRDLDDCIKRRNGLVINDTLKHVIKYRYRSAFVDEIEQLLQFKDILLKLRGYPRGINSLKEANEEMMKVSRPVPEVHNTMKALLLMLGYYGKMDDWLVIQSTIKVAPDTLAFKNILKQMEELDDPSFPWKFVNRSHVEKVRKRLHKYSYDKVFKASQAAALFYEWVEHCLSKVPPKKKPQQDAVGPDETVHEHRKRRKKRSHRH